MRTEQVDKRQRLRKQPRLRRVQSAGAPAMPRVLVSDTAKRRRRRQQTDRLRSTATTARDLVLSARWLSLAILAAAVYAIVTIGLSESFYLTRIPVDGVATIPPAEIVAASGLAGRHVFAANPNEAAAAIAEMPGIISATVTLAWPNQVTIRVVEDSPVAVWMQDGIPYWINKGGAIFPARGIEAPGLLVIESEMPAVADLSRTEQPATETNEDETSAETEATDEMAALPLQFVPADVLEGAMLLRQLRPNIDALYYRPSGGLSYQDGRGWRVHFGTGADMEQKLVVYETLVEDLLARGLTPTYISVSDQENPYYLTN